MKIVSFLLSLSGLWIASASSAWAQSSTGGCLDSPENPTAVLGLLGGAVAAYPAAYPWLRGRASALLRKRGK